MAECVKYMTRNICFGIILKGPADILKLLLCQNVKTIVVPLW